MATATGLYDNTDTLITKRVQTCIAAPDVLEIEHRTLDGQYTIDQIGTSAEIADAIVYLTAAQKLIFDYHKRIGAPVKVIFDGRYYTGIIRGRPNYQRIPATDGPKFETMFTLLVSEQGAV
jgi:hypothetical protein